MGTFHSVCARILRRHGDRVGIGRNFTIYDQDDQISAIKSAMQLAEVDTRSYHPRAILSRISAAKCVLQDPSGMREEAYSVDDEYGAHWIDICSRVYHYYEEALTLQNALDFDDLLSRTVHLLEGCTDVQQQYHDRYQYLHIDEFQDTNLVQYRLARLLTGSHRNLCVVGDPDQSIYSWRGADLRNFEEYRKDFPEVIVFVDNYRSGQKILDAAYCVIEDERSSSRERLMYGSQNQSSDETSLWHRIREWLFGSDVMNSNPSESSLEFGEDEPSSTIDSESAQNAATRKINAANSATGPGSVVLNELMNAEEEAQWAVAEVQRLSQTTEFRCGDCAILYRTNAQSRAFEDVCMRQGIPYRLVGGVRFYHRKEIKDAMCYLRVIYNPGDEVSLQRIINTPARGIGAKTVQQLTTFAARSGITTRAAMQEMAAARTENRAYPIQVTTRAARAIADLSVTLDRLGEAARELGVADLLDRVLDMSGLSRHIYAQDDADERWENILELRGLAEDYGPSGDGSADGLSAFLERVSLVSDVDGYERSDDAVTLITLHQTKGLEFPVVIMTGLESGLLPHARSMDTRDQIDEERRLCYVGMTRAEKRLYMSYALNRRGQLTMPSPFLDNLPDDVRAGSSLEYVHRHGPREYTPSHRRIRNENAVIGGEYGTSRRESRTRLGDGAGAGGEATRGRLRGNIDERLTEWDSSRSARPKKSEPVPLSVGEIVRHSVFGEGVVQEVQGTGDTEQATVNFGGDVGLKRLLVSLAPLERG